MKRKKQFQKVSDFLDWLVSDKRVPSDPIKVNQILQGHTFLMKQTTYDCPGCLDGKLVHYKHGHYKCTDPKCTWQLKDNEVPKPCLNN